jgi:hypothetical protein
LVLIFGCHVPVVVLVLDNWVWNHDLWVVVKPLSFPVVFVKHWQDRDLLLSILKVFFLFKTAIGSVLFILLIDFDFFSMLIEIFLLSISQVISMLNGSGLGGLDKMLSLLSGFSLKGLSAGDVLLAGLDSQEQPAEQLAQGQVVLLYLLHCYRLDVSLHEVYSGVSLLIAFLSTKHLEVGKSLKELVIQVVLSLFPEKLVGSLLTHVLSLIVQKVENRLHHSWHLKYFEFFKGKDVAFPVWSVSELSSDKGESG